MLSMDLYYFLNQSAPSATPARPRRVSIPSLKAIPLLKARRVVVGDEEDDVGVFDFPSKPVGVTTPLSKSKSFCENLGDVAAESVSDPSAAFPCSGRVRTPSAKARPVVGEKKKPKNRVLVWI